MSTSKPLVSVIIPVYNAETHLGECLESIIGQTYRDIEVIIVDDGSSDRSGIICDEFTTRDARIRTLHLKNRGVASARNSGLEAATGAYIMFADSDDILNTEAINLMIGIAMNKSAQVVSCQTNYMDIDAGIASISSDSTQDIIKDDSILRDFLKNIDGQSACARLYQSGIIKSVEFDTSLKVNEDKLFIYEVFKKISTHVRVDLPLYNYRQVAASASHSDFSDKFFDIERVADTILRDVAVRYPQEEAYAQIQTIRSWMELYTRMTLSSTARSQYKADYLRLRGKIGGVGFQQLDTRLATLRLFIIIYAPSLYLVLSLIYDKIFRKQPQ